MKLKKIILLVSCCGFLLAKGQSILSPDRNMKIYLALLKTEDGNKLSYSIQYKNKPIIINSDLGIHCWQGKNAFQITIMKEILRNKKDTIWTPLYGERNSIRDHYNILEISLSDSLNPRRSVHLQIRAYNEGVAFRYFIPEHPDGGEYLHITSEQTEFTLPQGTKAWYTPVAQSEYRLLPLSDWPGECERPLTLELPGGLFACLTEAEMVNYSRMKFALSNNKKNTVVCSMYGEVDEITPFYTPWRVVMVAENPGSLLQNNDLILNLNPPSKLQETSWIKPGKVMREMSLSTTGAMQLVDFAVKRNLQYIHFDAGWYGYEYSMASNANSVSKELDKRQRGGLDLPQVIDYAKKNGIGVFLYVNQRALAKQLDELLPLYRDWGICGLKFGFVQVGSHRWTTWLHEAVRKCADYHLMVNIHDEYRPTGFSRTFPNLMTQEGILGNEAMPDATHNCTLPFTRFIVGPADYTICYYRQKAINPNSRRTIQTTSAHQLALSVVYYSPLEWLYWYDSPKNSNDEPELEFFDRVPTVWDDTRVLAGEIGKYIVVARRSGDAWFMGSIAGNDGRNLKVTLDFLEPEKNYVAHIFSDGGDEIETATKVKVSRYLVNRGTILEMSLKNSGGEAAFFVPATPGDMENLKNYKDE
jgi:alpha-glucosidase